jgi:ABC-type dipeptide/oligopeptide/nickel transport system permease subunit
MSEGTLTLSKTLQSRGERARGVSRPTIPWSGAVGLFLLGILALMALFPQILAPYDPAELVGRPLQAPSGAHPLGTNDLGQDLLSELVWGARASLATGLVVGLLAVAIGTLAGMVSAASAGLVGSLLMRLADLTLVLPLLPLVILLSAYVGPNQRNIILLLTLVFWAFPARLVRARALNLQQEPYIEAARSVGCTTRRILFLHVWPGVRPLAIVQFVLIGSAAILAEASLSFLGLGDPAVESWGTTLYFARVTGAFLGDAWIWWVLPTGLLITASVLGMALVSFALEDRLDPSLRR